MNQLQWEIIVQVSTYFLVLVMAVGALALIFKGLFWQYIRVRTSLGRLVLVKIRSVNRDFFRVGRVEESMLVFKGTTGMKRISVESKDSFYRSLNVNWVDIDEEKNCIIKPDMTGITGFDAEKYENLYLRALYRPESVNKKEIIIIILLLGTLALIGVSVYMSYKMGKQVTGVQASIDALRVLVEENVPKVIVN